MAYKTNPVVSTERLETCIYSAQFWATNLGRFAEQIRKRADNYTIASVILSAVTGLGVWPMLAASTEWPAKLAVSIVALATTVVTTIPRIKGYAECAPVAQELGRRYGRVLGQLMDAREMLRKGHPEDALKAIAEFEEIRAAKQALKPYPTDLQIELDKQRKKLRIK